MKFILIMISLAFSAHVYADIVVAKQEKSLVTVNIYSTSSVKECQLEMNNFIKTQLDAKNKVITQRLKCELKSDINTPNPSYSSGSVTFLNLCE